MALPARRTARPTGLWDPFAALEDLSEEMSRLLTNVFPDVGRISVNAWSPPVDVEETDDAYLVEADMPGVKPEDVTVEVQGNDLRIAGRVEEDPQRRRSRRASQFDYRLTLPGEVNTESCQAELEHGVLRLRLAKSAAAVRHRIPVQYAARAELSGGQEGYEQHDEEHHG